MTGTLTDTIAEVFGTPPAPPTPAATPPVPPTPPRRGGLVLDGDDNGYGRAALDRECERVTTTAPGQGRNHALNRAAFSLGQLVAGGVLDESLVVGELTAAAELAGLDTDTNCGPHGIAATIASGLAAGSKRPRSAPAPGTTAPPVPAPAASVVAEAAPDAARFGPTEDGLARALVAAHGHELRYCPQRESWLVWDAYRWVWDHAGKHRERVRTLARGLPESKGWATFKRRALTAGGVSGVVRLAATDPAITVDAADLDARAYELNTPTGIVDMRTGRLRAPDPAALHTRATACAPDFDRTSDAFDAFLKDTFGDDDLAAYVQRLIGVSAIGAVSEQVLPFAHGAGANGKSTLMEACMHALGRGDDGYAIAAPSEVLMSRRNEAHPTELASLAGARMVVCSELEDGQRFAESRVKLLTGRDSISARFVHRDLFTFEPSHTLWLLGNHRPTARSGGPAFWRRVRLIPFTHVVPPERRDPLLPERLAADAAAVLAWIIAGAADYHAHGLNEPASVTNATAAYARDEDTVARFVDDECHLADNHTLVRCDTTRVREAYEHWCRDTGEEPVSAKRLGIELRDRFGVGAAKSNGRRFYTGITVLAEDPEDPKF